jgi:hypothetical protein
MLAAKRYAHTQTLRLNAPPASVFPLFGPVREAEWVAGWSPTILYAESALADHAGAIFTTAHPPEALILWYVNRFDGQNYQAEYLRIQPDLLQAEAVENATQVTVTYTFTALSAAGNPRIHQLSHHHPQRMAQWEAALNRLF